MLEKLMLAIAITMCIKLLLGVGVPISHEPAKPSYRVVENPKSSLMKVIFPRDLRQQLAFREW
ncbi:hypothetical protein [Chroococcidiopsis sp. SAG 2025]|uniref:hypothetical protein n=1 Tax=Chroococcidiopsis sp. SAG 2025 TaxID=171389 RepID=UPI0029372BF8|nr:hypothetical protein [Chroococcidiopsis sp. SAG 2025]